MAWPIPVIPEQPVLSPPRYGMWLVILVVIVVSCSLSIIFIGNITAYGQLLLYGVLPGLLLWLCLFGVALNRYEQSSASAQAWKEETARTKAQWQQWSRAQLAVVGSVLLTPEAEGVSSVLGKLADIPMYPQKARPLFGSPLSLSVRLHEIDNQLERQCPGYRHHLHTVYLLHAPKLPREPMISAVHGQWGLVPDIIDDIGRVPILQLESEFSDVVLLLCLQHWPGSFPEKSSEFISAQLLASPTFAHAHTLSVIAGMGRMMPLIPGKLSADLDMLFDYTLLDRDQLQHVWLTGKAENTLADIALYAANHNWSLPKERPVHLIDLSFGPPGELSFGISLAMMAEAISKTSRDQLVICQAPQSSGWLCLVTSELFS
ncbi:hypothetical protein [Serratia aquatilis]|uniref:Type VI secretion protein n=1 Tax=Serratia aquatilis TaxID=1737515 RepID=A0ABV6EI66_9GAMM